LSPLPLRERARERGDKKRFILFTGILVI